MISSDFFQRLSKLSASDLQIYASKCLQAYCNAKQIKHPSIDELLVHLESRPENNGLNEWEGRGALLALNGRGDEIPKDLIQSIPPQIIEEFSYIVDCTVEVGIVDMYGAATELPFEFLRKIILILSQNKVNLPKL
ncbi:hypothetical protein [Pseudomonas capsici]|uniref:hypothetical protein n=1 Tax=Pseudomonas capsici TaxID=2810614 RepID=UPI0013C2C63B|nr:hypothetical protein [Pseudomonas capsici]MCV4284822.1 hypothetical protein [Pseudomonas capsici]MCV4341778.1 hypothetical protein [Pseudomonas capsici]